MNLFTMSRKAYVILALLAVLSIVGVFAPAPVVRVMTLVFFYGLLGASWNILGGYAGQLNLGHAMFLGVGGYTSTLLLLNYGLSPWIGMLVAGIVSATMGVMIGYPSFRLRGSYFALSTLAFAEVLKVLFVYFRDITGGGLGLGIPYIGNSPLMFQFIGGTPYFFICLFLMLTAIYVTRLLERSKLGYYLVAIREDQELAEAVGVNSTRCKILAMVPSAFLGGIAGTFYAQFIYFIEPRTVFGFPLSLQSIVVSVLGGPGTIWGPFLGSAILIPLGESLNYLFGGSFAGVHLIIYGALLILVAVAMPRGLLDYIKRKYGNLFISLEKKE